MPEITYCLPVWIAKTPLFSILDSVMDPEKHLESDINEDYFAFSDGSGCYFSGEIDNAYSYIMDDFVRLLKLDAVRHFDETHKQGELSVIYKAGDVSVELEGMSEKLSVDTIKLKAGQVLKLIGDGFKTDDPDPLISILKALEQKQQQLDAALMNDEVPEDFTLSRAVVDVLNDLNLLSGARIAFIEAAVPYLDTEEVFLHNGANIKLFDHIEGILEDAGQTINKLPALEARLADYLYEPPKP